MTGAAMSSLRRRGEKLTWQCAEPVTLTAEIAPGGHEGLLKAPGHDLVRARATAPVWGSGRGLNCDLVVL